MIEKVKEGGDEASGYGKDWFLVGSGLIPMVDSWSTDWL